MIENKVVEFVPLLDHDDYEILNEYPFTIRRKDNHYEISESINGKKGYVQVHLNCKPYSKHRLIAKQFLQNPNNLPCIDHRNKIKTDYHLTNLRWCSNSTNNRNRTSTRSVIYTFVDEIYEDSIEVTDYNNHEFEEYYYDQTVDKFYFWNGIQFRELHINEHKSNGSKYVWMQDKNNANVKVAYAKFKKLYGFV